MLRRVWILGLAPLVVSAVAGAAHGGPASPSAMVIDRTLECTVPGVGFPESVRYLNAFAQPRMGGGAALADPTANFFTEAPDDSSLAGFQMGRLGRTRNPGLLLNRRSCKVMAKRPAFSSRGLRGGRITFGDQYTCDVPATVRVRVRAVFSRSVTLSPYSRDRDYLRAAGPIATAQVVVTTLKGVRIVYVAADSRTGRVQLFQSPARCFPA